ncbi:hypothetical protein [Rhizobium ruizarguesonis]|nr:hypothetical protein [Rhizobium ruizarguesonis]
MHLADTRIEHDAGGWKIDFIGDDGDALSVKVANDDDEPLLDTRH